MADAAGRDAVAAVWRIESARITGALARYTGDFALAEDVAQEALAEALGRGPRDGALRTPGPGRCINAIGRRAARDDHCAAPAGELDEGAPAAGSPHAPDGDCL